VQREKRKFTIPKGGEFVSSPVRFLELKAWLLETPESTTLKHSEVILFRMAVIDTGGRYILVIGFNPSSLYPDPDGYGMAVDVEVPLPEEERKVLVYLREIFKCPIEFANNL
jgi:hypothetical protein